MDYLRISIFCFAVIFTFVCSVAHAGVDEIRVLYQDTNEYLKMVSVKPVLLYAEEKLGNIEWKKVVSGADVIAFNKSDFRAQVYLRDGKVIKSQIETTSESGDWKLKEEYYFYRNESAAFYFQTLLTYQAFDFEHNKELPDGPYIVEKRFYYDEEGKSIRQIEKAFVQATQQSIPVKYVRAELPIELYLNVKALPFFKAIKRQ